MERQFHTFNAQQSDFPVYTGRKAGKAAICPYYPVAGN